MLGARTALAAAALAGSLVLAATSPAWARNPEPILELAYDGVLIAGPDIDFKESLSGGTIGLLLMDKGSNPFMMGVTLGLGGQEWTHPSTMVKWDRYLLGLTVSVGMGMGAGKRILPFAEVGLGPRFLMMSHGKSKKVRDWAWTIGLMGRVGLLFKLNRAIGLKLGLGFESISLYYRKENLGGIWLTAGLLLGNIGKGSHYQEPPPPPPPQYYEPPPPYHPQPTSAAGGDFSISAWIEWNGGESGGKPVLYVRVLRGAGFEADPLVWVVMPDGNAFDMQHGSLGDPDLYKLNVFTLGLECGSQYIAIKAKSGWTSRESSVEVSTPCPFIPGGQP